MKSKIPQLLQDLRDDVEVLGFCLLVDQVDAIAEAYAKENKPKVAVKKKVQPKAGLTLILTTSGASNRMVFDTEAKAEAWMKNYQKLKAKQVDSFLKEKGIYKPTLQYGRLTDYKRESEIYLERLRVAGLDTSIIIERC